MNKTNRNKNSTCTDRLLTFWNSNNSKQQKKKTATGYLFYQTSLTVSIHIHPNPPPPYTQVKIALNLHLYLCASGVKWTKAQGKKTKNQVNVKEKGKCRKLYQYQKIRDTVGLAYLHAYTCLHIIFSPHSLNPLHPYLPRNHREKSFVCVNLCLCTV